MVEQKKVGCTDLRIEFICFLSVVRSCFLETGLVGSCWSCAKTTVGIRPWALSLADTRLPVYSLGMAWIVWNEKE